MSRVSSENPTRARWPITFQFRLVHIFYVTALVGSTLATFGPDAILLAAVILAFWAYVFSRRSRPRGLLEACLLLLFLFC
jgi:hypothetical protein